MKNAEEQLRLIGAKLSHRRANHVARVLSFDPRQHEWKALCSCNIDLIFSLSEMQRYLAEIGNWAIARSSEFWYVTATKAIVAS